MITKTKKEPKPKKEPTYPVNFRIGVSIISRLDKFGLRGAISKNIVKRFLRVCEILKNTERTEPFTYGTGGAVYINHMHNDTYHLTSKNGTTITTVELDSESMAKLISDMVDLINTHNPHIPTE